MKRFLIKLLLPDLGSLIASAVYVKTGSDDVGKYIHVKLALFGENLFNRKFYLATDGDGNFKPNQIIKS